ncbi:hypothetical protein MMC29_003081 [Sticta canariensis]|nr:hypothetical protein [Sticta canariensis]
MNFASSSVSSVFLRTVSICVLLFTAFAAIEAKPDFEKCFADFNRTQYEHGTYDGNTSIIYQGQTYLHHEPSPEERRFIVSTEGCRTLCGSGVQYYHWSQIAATITTWVLPIIGTLLQAPYEGNEFRKTLYALIRWIGSPIASLSYILWNIKVTGKCALLSDMSTLANLDSRDEESDQPKKNMLEMRDSLYILSVMNQYTVKSPIDPEQAETLLRVALFADITTPTWDLKARREKLALTLREGRKRGIVPVFVTLMWFLFSLAISIQAAFSSLGENATAHDLALGLLLAWFPVLILSSIVDRNPTQSAGTRTKLNKLLKEVQLALRTNGAAAELIRAVKTVDTSNNVHTSNNVDVQNGNDVRFALNWVGSINAQPNAPGDPTRFSGATGGIEGPGVPDDFDQENPQPLASKFFDEFAGQGRVRWHYGVAHPILAGMQAIILDKCTNENPRNWLQIRDIQKHLVRGREKDVLLLHFDLREFWEILSAFLIVIGTISGAFVLSFRTPTVGLGCRAGGYAIFGIMAAGIFSLELLVWGIIVAPKKKKLSRRGEQIAPESQKQKLKRIARWNWMFRFLELVNTAWLIYIVMAQTIGSYQNCDCQAANWGRDGGYINAKVALKADGGTVEAWWITGALLSSLIMFTAIAFLVIEWCEQSHLNSVDLNKSMNGLKVTRRFKYYTLWIRMVPSNFIYLCKRLWRTFSDSWWNKSKEKEKKGESLLWSY